MEDKSEKQQILEAHTQAAPAAETMEAAGGRGVALTERAAEEVKRVIQEEGLPANTCLRVGAKGGGCSGFSYEMFFDTERADDDLEVNFGEIRVVVDPSSAQLLEGATLDYKDGLNEAGFSIDNPNAQRTCGCGQSFS